jgi:nicotinamidase-related amidase
MEIVNGNYIGSVENPVDLNEILKKADKEGLEPSLKDKERVLFLGIDVQQDFMDHGALGVAGAQKDVERMTRFIYDNMEKISNIAVSMDTHTPHQIFHPCWWIDENGEHPAPYTMITLKDLDEGRWRAVINPQASREYVKHLEQDAKKALCIWTYHCMQGTTGAALENQFANMIYFHSVARKAVVQRLVKGQDPMSEMYGIIRPEYDTKGYMNLEFLNKLERFDKVLIAGEAKSHCVLESIKQILEYYETRPEVTEKVYVLEDCMSSISGYEDMANQMFEDFRKRYRIHLVKSTDGIL